MKQPRAEYTFQSSPTFSQILGSSQNLQDTQQQPRVTRLAGMVTVGWGSTKHLSLMENSPAEGWLDTILPEHIPWPIDNFFIFLQSVASFPASSLRPTRAHELTVWLQIIHTLGWDLFPLFLFWKPEGQQGVVVLRAKCLLPQGSGAGGASSLTTIHGAVGTCLPFWGRHMFQGTKRALTFCS